MEFERYWSLFSFSTVISTCKFIPYKWLKMMNKKKINKNNDKITFFFEN